MKDTMFFIVMAAFIAFGVGLIVWADNRADERRVECAAKGGVVIPKTRLCIKREVVL